VDQKKITRGGIYLAKLDPAKAAEVGKIRPVVILNVQAFLNIEPPIIFVCPLSSHSKPEYQALHVRITERDNLQVTSFALIEHCRSISLNRIIYPRLAQLDTVELNTILHRLQRLVGMP